MPCRTAALGLGRGSAGVAPTSSRSCHRDPGDHLLERAVPFARAGFRVAGARAAQTRRSRGRGRHGSLPGCAGSRVPSAGGCLALRRGRRRPLHRRGRRRGDPKPSSPRSERPSRGGCRLTASRRSRRRAVGLARSRGNSAARSDRPRTPTTRREAERESCLQPIAGVGISGNSRAWAHVDTDDCAFRVEHDPECESPRSPDVVGEVHPLRR